MKAKLRLYVTGITPTAEALVGQLRSLLEESLGSDFELEVLDAFEHPEALIEDAIVMTPTLARILPPPTIHIIGDLSNKARVLASLDLDLDPDAAASDG
ncbi:circadian clock protein KaiB [Synechococcus sp. RSCCF101]|uniref:circadian clock KaiB family protein n=1 Tax=Synechococcus sp. RSCCF101 TaxID=2511069 RepID=UPI0012487E67|nr:circadian clock KaiB family protein [Synechococcus sp. RSCCF101]QEY30908.1 circadian clock protein KaiB [Synechococcus sp. RSCCF101]